MRITLELAKTPQQLDQVFSVRHQVYVGDGYLAPRHDRRLVDRFDAFPGTANFIMTAGSQVVGSIRYVEAVPSIGAPADQFFDFSPHLPPTGTHGSLSKLCVTRPFRSQPRLLVGLVGIGTYWASSRGVTHLYVATNPDLEGHLQRMGYRSVAPPFFHDKEGLPVVPMVLALDDLSDHFVDFIRRQTLDPFLDSFDRTFYDAGDVLIERGAEGDEVFILTAGQVGVHWSQREAPDHVLERGALFGEIALFTDRPRSASVVALTEVSVMVMSRRVFQQHLEQHPAVARRLFSVIANRLLSLEAKVMRRPDDAR